MLSVDSGTYCFQIPIVLSFDNQGPLKNGSNDQATFSLREEPARSYFPQLCSTSSSFHPLPPLPCAPPLQLPNFLDFSTHAVTPATEAVPRSHPPVVSLMPDQPTLSQPILPSVQETRPPTIPNELFEIPILSHPNSPYVPWASSVRCDIFRPMTPSSHISGFSSCYSRPYSRSGAQAPEPPTSPEQSTNKLLKVSNSFKNLRRVVKKNFKRAAKHISNLRGPFQRSLRTGSQATHKWALPELEPSPSVVSLESRNTDTLEIWLAARQREAAESENDQMNTMTLDEYERMGSWINLRNTRQGGDASYVSPYLMNSRRVSETANNENTSHSPAVSILWLLEDHHAILGPQSISPLLPKPSNSYFQSSPQLSPPSGCSNSPFDISPCANPDTLFSGVLERRNREMSMPGGWTFRD